MKTIFADFNAMTEGEHVCLTTLGSQEDLQRGRFEPGDWAWLSDGELLVGARLANDPYFGLVGVPAWDTLVHLDDEGRDFAAIWADLQRLLTTQGRSADDETRLLRLLA